MGKKIYLKQKSSLAIKIEFYNFIISSISFC